MRFLFLVILVCAGFVGNLSAQTNLAEKSFEIGSRLAKAGKFESAIDHYERSLSLVEADRKTNHATLLSRIHYNIGACNYHLKRFKNAEKSLRKAVNLSSGDYEKALYALGLTRIELRKFRSAKRSFQTLVEKNDKHAEAWFDLGMVLLEQEDYQSAKDAFLLAMKNESVRSAEARNNIGVIEAAKGDLNAAEKQFRAALSETEGKLTIALKNLEFCLFYQHRERMIPIAKLKYSNSLGGKLYG